MVFSVSPMNTSPDYVHPVAENFTDFLRLILACGDVAAVEQAWMWNEAQFEAFLNENPTTQEQQRTLSEISEKMNLLPMEQPWTYIKNLQSSFDYSQIKYTEDYYDNDMTSEAELVAPEWKVYFDGDFWGHRGKDRAGKEIKLDKQFDWAGYHWVIPAAYSCSKGLVVDFCMRVDSESIRDFMKKWNLDWENDSCENFTREQQMQMEWENPLCFNFKPCLKLNEKILQTTHGCAVSFNPCLPDGVINELEAKWAIDHYGLDSTYGWVICRDVFPWGTKHHPEINKLFLTMEQQPGQVPGSHFKVHAPGDSFMFSHPVSGITHTLTVQEIEQQTVPQNSFGSDRWIYPTHYIAMSYTLTPEPMENISVFDCDEGDRPIEVTPDDHSFRPVGSSSCFVVGVIMIQANKYKGKGIMRKLLIYLNEYRKECILAPLFKLLEASFELIVPLVVAAIIDHGIAASNKSYIFKMGGVMVLLALIGLACSITAQYFAAKAAVGFSTKVRYALFSECC